MNAPMAMIGHRRISARTYSIGSTTPPSVGGAGYWSRPAGPSTTSTARSPPNSAQFGSSMPAGTTFSGRAPIDLVHGRRVDARGPGRRSPGWPPRAAGRRPARPVRSRRSRSSSVMFVAAPGGAPPLRTRTAMPPRCSWGMSVVVGAAGSVDARRRRRRSAGRSSSGSGAVVDGRPAGRSSSARSCVVVDAASNTNGGGVRRDDLRGAVVGERDADQDGHADERDAADDLTDAASAASVGRPSAGALATVGRTVAPPVAAPSVVVLIYHRVGSRTPSPVDLPRPRSSASSTGWPRLAASSTSTPRRSS